MRRKIGMITGKLVGNTVSDDDVEKKGPKKGMSTLEGVGSGVSCRG